MYKISAGMEVHVELKSKRKIFSKSFNSYCPVANTNITAYDLAYPGTLELLNQEVIDLALKAALLLNCQINKTMTFDRKHYFYPDNPKAYQITQAKTPIGVDGYVEIELDGKKKKIGIIDIHIEEDTAKAIHLKDKSLLDFNRASVPLVEIVSAADLSNEKEAMAFINKLRELLVYASISDGKIEEGSLRCDVNISISQDENLGTRTELKNISSISSVGKAILAEAKRQEELLEEGKSVELETRRYDEKEDTTIFLRKKDPANDYYFLPELNIPPLILSDDYIEKIKNSLPISADQRRQIYLEAKILPINVEKLIANKSLSDYLNKFLSQNLNLVTASNLLLGDLSYYLNKENKTIEETNLTDENFISLVKLFDESKINSKIIKEILDDLMTKDLKLIKILEDANLLISDNPDDLKDLISKVIKDNPESIKDYLSGNKRAFKHLMGMLMKESKGQIRADLANQELAKAIDNLD